MHTLQFITWDVSPTFLHLGPLNIQWYGLLFAACMVAGYMILSRIYKQENVPQKRLDQLAVYIFIGMLVGARLGHCLFYDPAYYLAHPIEMLLPIAETAEGWQLVGYRGLASHGGAIGILLMVALYARKTKTNYLWTLDRLVIVVALAGMFIRTGNLMNSEIYGVATDLPWGMVFVQDGQVVAKHPTQIYEALCYLAIAIGLYLYYRKQQKQLHNGLLLGMFLTALFSTRFLIEFLKECQEPWEANLPINMGQMLSLPFIIAGVILIILARKNRFGSTIDIEKPQHHTKNQ